jgi:putative peptide zinc metalloprotease protein
VSSGSAVEGPFVVGGELGNRRSSGDGTGGSAARAGAAVPSVAPVPIRADGVELLGEVGGSGYRRRPALVRRGDGQTVQLTPFLYLLLELIDGERGHEELAELLGGRIGRHVTSDDVRFLTDARLRALGLLQLPDGTPPAVAGASPLLALRMKLVVSNPASTRRLTTPFVWLFRPFAVVPVVVAFALTTWWIAFVKGLASATHQMLYRPALILVVLALLLLSAAFHEIGHAAACRYGGARPGRMGIGLYLVWPAFYTDVSDSYRLGRGGRLRVDLGGLYFNAVFAVATLGVWSLVRWDALLLVIAAQPVLMVRQLVPFVRFDGYHILADLVGVPDLFLHIKPTLLGLLPTRRGRKRDSRLKTWVRAVVTLWVVLVVPVLAGFLGLMVVTFPRVAATAWSSLGLQQDALAAGWGQGDAATVVVRLFSMLLIVLPMGGTVYLLARVGRRNGQRILRATAGRPLLRAGAGLATLMLAAGLVWAWWPGGGQYRPIGPGTHGRVTDLPRLPATRPIARVPAAATAQPAGHAEWMLVLLPRRSPGSQSVGRPIVVLPQPVQGGAPGAAGAAPAPQPPTSGTVPAAQPAAPADAPQSPITTPAPAAGAIGASPAGEPATVAVPGLRPPADAGGSTNVTLVSPPPPADAPGSAWVFPFDSPPPPREGDNQALAVNTTNGSTKYEVALALVWVTNGGPVDERNTAYAAASCTNCQTVAVAFQAVFVIGYAQVVTPVNEAVAVNYHCKSCVTGALAVQLVVTLSRAPSGPALRDLAAAEAQLEQQSKSFELQPLTQVHAELTATRAQLLAILAGDGAIASTTTATRTSETGTSATDATTGVTTVPSTSASTATTTAPPTTTASTTTAPPTTAPPTTASTTTAPTTTATTTAPATTSTASTTTASTTTTTPTTTP